MTGPRFVDPPAYTFRNRPWMKPGLLALVGAIVALAFLLLLIGVLEMGFKVRLDDLARSLIPRDPRPNSYLHKLEH